MLAILEKYRALPCLDLLLYVHGPARRMQFILNCQHCPEAIFRDRKRSNVQLCDSVDITIGRFLVYTIPRNGYADC